MQVATVNPHQEVQIFREDTDDWVVGLMHSVVDNLRRCGGHSVLLH